VNSPGGRQGFSKRRAAKVSVSCPPTDDRRLWTPKTVPQFHFWRPIPMAFAKSFFVAVAAALSVLSPCLSIAQSASSDYHQELAKLRTQIQVRTDRTFNLGETMDPRDREIAERLARVPGEFSSLIRRGRIDEAVELQKQVFELLPKSQQGFRNAINPAPKTSPLTLKALDRLLMSVAQESAVDSKLRTSLLLIVTQIGQEQSAMIGDSFRMRFLELLSLWTAPSSIWRYEMKDARTHPVTREHLQLFAQMLPEPEKTAHRKFEDTYNRAFNTLKCERGFIPVRD
jgi:hypothetical protein